MVEHRIPPSSLRTHKWRYATYQLELLWLLQLPSPSGCHRPSNHRTRHRGRSVCTPFSFKISFSYQTFNSGPEMVEDFEILIRSILIRPEHPAVLLLGHFSPQIQTAHGFAGPDHWHNTVAQFYDLPHISIKPVLFPEYLHDPTSIGKYYVDPILANTHGHDLLTDILVAYFQSQICTAWSVANGAAFDAVPLHTPGEAHGLFGGIGQRKGVPEPDSNKADKEGTDADGNRLKADPISPKDAALALAASVPAERMNSRPNSGRPYEEVSPFCVSANDLINPLPPSLFYGSGWNAQHPSTAGSSSLHAAAHYWYSTLPTSKIRIPLQVGAGDIGIYYLREPVSKIGEGSSVECWVDDNYGGAKVIENAADIHEPASAYVFFSSQLEYVSLLFVQLAYDRSFCYAWFPFR